jgi:hypothetical protein
MVVCGSVLLSLSLSDFAHAQAANSSAFGISASATGGVSLSVVPSPAIAGNQGPPFSLNNSLANLNVGPNVVVTGLMTVDTSWVQLPINNHSDATTNGLAVTIPAFVSLTATTVASSADVTGTCNGNLAAAGTSTLTNPVLTIAGLGVALPVNPAPNTAITLPTVAGLSGSLILNEQIGGGDGINTRNLQVNAVHLNIALLLPPQTLNLVVADSIADVNCTLPVSLQSFDID